MGAANVLLVYRTWGTVLGDQAMRVMIYMAIVARDGDAAPWFGLGHEALAELALGREVPGKDKDPKGYEAAMRSVRRPVAELHRAGAITTAKRATNNGGNVRYRLWLDGPSPDVSRPVSNPPACEQPAAEPVDNPPVTGRKTSGELNGHRTFRGRSPDGKRPVHIEEEGGANTSNGSVVTARCGKRARDPPVSLRPEVKTIRGGPP